MNYNSPGSRMPQPTAVRPPMLGPQPVRPMNGNSSPWVNQAQPGMQMAALPPQPGYSARQAARPARRTPGRPAPPFIGPSEGDLLDRIDRDEQAQRARDAADEIRMQQGRDKIYGPQTETDPPIPPYPPPPSPPSPYQGLRPPRPPYPPLRQPRPPYRGQTQMPVYPPPRQAPYPVFGVNDIDTLLPPYMGPGEIGVNPVRNYDQRPTPYDRPRIPYQERPLNPFMFT